jgi:hypothetical protein
MARFSRGMRQLLLLCLASFGGVSNGLAQSFSVATEQLLIVGRVYKYTCGSPLTVTSDLKDRQKLSVKYMNTDRSEVVITALNATQVDMAVRLIKCVCFKPENGYYLLSFSRVSVIPGTSFGSASAADFISYNRNLCVP